LAFSTVFLGEKPMLGPLSVLVLVIGSPPAR
jgi:hypothetical protein